MTHFLRCALYGVASLTLDLIIFTLFVSGLLFALVGAYDADVFFGMFSAMAFALAAVLFLAKVSSDLEEGGHARVIPIIHE